MDHQTNGNNAEKITVQVVDVCIVLDMIKKRCLIGVNTFTDRQTNRGENITYR